MKLVIILYTLLVRLVYLMGGVKTTNGAPETVDLVI